MSIFKTYVLSSVHINCSNRVLWNASSLGGGSDRPNNVTFFAMLRANVTCVTRWNPHGYYIVTMLRVFRKGVRVTEVLKSIKSRRAQFVPHK